MVAKRKEGCFIWIYYGWILLSVLMFGGGFAIQDLYRKKRGSGLKISMESTCIGALAGVAVLLAYNGFSLNFTAFTFCMALWAAINGMAFTFCTFKALDCINLSLFSLFAMLGGMILPFFQGIVFYAEGISVAKIICVAFVCAALLCTVERGARRRGSFFYVGIFVLNGMSGVISKLFAVSELPKTDALEYSVWIALATVVLSSGAWLSLEVYHARRAAPQEREAPTPPKALVCSYALGAACGVINRVANLLLVFALLYVDSSVQYPLVTGGTMIVSTLFSFFGDKKPGKREIAGVAFAFCGMCALFFIPI